MFEADRDFFSPDGDCAEKLFTSTSISFLFKLASKVFNVCTGQIKFDDHNGQLKLDWSISWVSG